MKNLWAPWKINYIRENDPGDGGCIFEICSEKKFAKENLLLYRDALIVVLLNRFPYANGHLLIAPCRHIGDIGDLTSDESTSLFEMVRKSVAILRKHEKPDGFNIGINLGEVAGAGQTPIYRGSAGARPPYLGVPSMVDKS